MFLSNDILNNRPGGIHGISNITIAPVTQDRVFRQVGVSGAYTIFCIGTIRVFANLTLKAGHICRFDFIGSIDFTVLAITSKALLTLDRLDVGIDGIAASYHSVNDGAVHKDANCVLGIVYVLPTIRAALEHIADTTKTACFKVQSMLLVDELTIM
jgi:hypothetical protein